MDQITAWLEYLRGNPAYAVGVAAAVGVLFYFLNRKPKMAREAEERLDKLRKDRADQYNQYRPPR